MLASTASRFDSTVPRRAWASANSGSSSRARRYRAIASLSSAPDTRLASARLKALRASNDGGGRPGQGHVHRPHRGQRLAQARAQGRRGDPQRVEHRGLVRRPFLLHRQRVAGGAGQRLERDRIGAAQLGDRAAQDRLGLFALAHLEGHVGGQPRVGRPAHQAQRLAHAHFGHDVQKRRLPDGDRQRRVQRVVERRIAGEIGDVGQHHQVALGQRRRRRRPEHQGGGHAARRRPPPRRGIA